MTSRTSCLARQDFSRLNHDNILACFDELIRSRDTRNTGSNNTDVCLKVLREFAELWSVGVGFGMDPDGLLLARGVHVLLGRRCGRDGRHVESLTVIDRLRK